MIRRYDLVVGAAYFGEASTMKDRASLNSCNFLRVRAHNDAAPYWQGCRFRISGAVPGEKVEARLHLSATPNMDDTFGVDDGGALYEHAGKAARTMHVVTVDFNDNIREWIEEIITRALK